MVRPTAFGHWPAEHPVAAKLGAGVIRNEDSDIDRIAGHMEHVGRDYLVAFLHAIKDAAIEIKRHASAGKA